MVTITSLVGIGTPLRSGYAASKHALHGFFDSLRAEIHTAGINVLLDYAVFIQTEISKNALAGNGKSWNDGCGTRKWYGCQNCLYSN